MVSGVVKEEDEPAKEEEQRYMKKHGDRIDHIGEVEVLDASLQVGTHTNAFVWDEALFCALEIDA